jgi:hypothetical protein
MMEKVIQFFKYLIEQKNLPEDHAINAAAKYYNVNRFELRNQLLNLNAIEPVSSNCGLEPNDENLDLIAQDISKACLRAERGKRK